MRKLFLLTVLICVALTGCMKATLEEKNNENEVTNTYTKIEDMDFASGYIEGEIRENFFINASVPTNVPKECGIYEIARKDLNMTELEYTKYFDEIIDNYYGRDVTISDADKKSESELLETNSSYTGNVGDYYNASNPRDYYSNAQIKLHSIETVFCDYGLDYDKEFIDGIVNDFLEKCAGIIPDGMKGDYVCVHIDDEYYDYFEKKYGKEGAEHIWPYRDDMEFYAVNMYSEVEESIYFKGFEKKGYNRIADETIDEVCVINRMSGEGHMDIYSHEPQRIEMVISEEGEVLYFRISDYYTIEEKTETVEILDTQVALEVFCQQYDGVLLENDIIVKDISLQYTVELSDEVDETGYRNAKLIPVWVIRYNPPMDYWDDMFEMRMTISAVDGSIYSEN